ncbi:MAG: hypothetical protein ACD_8C00008G0001 [uncultured bacterium]|nr:MAG: hypothetical protein ACD_8C00008G0001 [uncultured bacterium]
MATKMKSLLGRQTRKKGLMQSCAQMQLFRRKDDLPWNDSDGEKLLSKKSPNQVRQLLFRRKTDLDYCSELEDNDLIVVIQTQNPEAYRELFSRYQKKLFAYIYHLVGNREETEDILQNVFSKTYKNLEHFDLSRKFSSWIYRIAHNESVNYLKRKSKRYTISWEDVSTSKDKLESASNEERPEERMEHQEIVKEVDGAMEKLAPQYKQILKMRYFQEYSYEDISKILKKPVNTVGTLINRAKRKLSEVVKEGK